MQLIRSELQADSSLTLQVRFDFTRKLIEPYAHAHAHACLLATPPPVYGPDYAVGILLQSNEVAGASIVFATVKGSLKMWKRFILLQALAILIATFQSSRTEPMGQRRGGNFNTNPYLSARYVKKLCCFIFYMYVM